MLNRILLLLFPLLVCLLFYTGCRKLDDYQMETSYKDGSFFELQSGTDSRVAAIAACMLRRNAATPFTGDIARKAGLPLWNKAIISVPVAEVATLARQSENIAVNLSVSGGYHTLIPLMSRTGRLNAILEAKVSGADTLFRLIHSAQYALLPSRPGNADADMFSSRQNLLRFFAGWESSLTGNKTFLITDTSYFGEDRPEKYKSIHIESFNAPQSQLGRVSVQVCVTTYVQTHGCGPDDPNAQWAPVTSCTTTYLDGPGGGSGGGPVGAGGGSGGGPPNPDGWGDSPCVDLQPVARPLPCHGDTENDDPPIWVPVGDEPLPNDPCDVVSTIKSDNDYKVRAQSLANSTHLDYEKAYVKYPNLIGGGGYVYYQGQPNAGSVGVPWIDTVENVNHSHTDGSLFSPEDFQVAYHAFIHGHTSDSIFTLGVSVENGASYVITISNLSAFLAFGQTWLHGEDDLREIYDVYYGYKIGDLPTQVKNEKALLEFIKDQNIGASLLKANDDFSNYVKLQLNSQGILVSSPCN